VTDRNNETEDLATLREAIEAGIAKSKRLVARSRELIGAATAEEPEPPAIKADPTPSNSARN
jgi:hypothetical protein